MATNISKESVVIFDLDDTLYKEIEYLKSAFKKIAQILEEDIGKNIFDEMIDRYRAGDEVFGFVIEQHNVQSRTKDQLIEIYRNHQPVLHLEDTTADKLEEIKHACSATGLITDGRSYTQRNKLKSLGLENYFDEVVISEEFGSTKPDPRNFTYIQEKLQGNQYVYIGENIRKDFIAPNRLGWKTICVLDNGLNIHPQNYSSVDLSLYQPQHLIKSFIEINISRSISSLRENIR